MQLTNTQLLSLASVASAQLYNNASYSLNGVNSGAASVTINGITYRLSGNQKDFNSGSGYLAGSDGTSYTASGNQQNYNSGTGSINGTGINYNGSASGLQYYQNPHAIGGSIIVDGKTYNTSGVGSQILTLVKDANGNYQTAVFDADGNLIGPTINGAKYGSAGSVQLVLTDLNTAHPTVTVAADGCVQLGGYVSVGGSTSGTSKIIIDTASGKIPTDALKIAGQTGYVCSFDGSSTGGNGGGNGGNGGGNGGKGGNGGSQTTSKLSSTPTMTPKANDGSQLAAGILSGMAVVGALVL